MGLRAWLGHLRRYRLSDGSEVEEPVSPARPPVHTELGQMLYVLLDEQPAAWISAVATHEFRADSPAIEHPGTRMRLSLLKNMQRFVSVKNAASPNFVQDIYGL